MTSPILKSLLGHSSLTSAYVAVDRDGNIVLVNEDGTTSATLGVGLTGRLANQLRDELGQDNEIRFLRGFATDGDGGEGDFRWSNTPVADDGGTVLNDAGFGSSSAGWRRIYSGPLNVKWFGAKGDGVTDDSAAIQRAVDSAQNANQFSGAAGTGVYTMQDVFLPKGVYKINTCIDKPSYIGLIGESQCSLKGNNASTDILRIGSGYNKIQNIIFAGGRRAIVIGGFSAHYGTNLGDGSLDLYGGTIDNCFFRYQSGPSIAKDSSTDHRAGAQTFVCSNFGFEGCTLFYGGFDGFFFDNGRIIADATTLPVLFDSGATMGVFVNGGGVLSVSHITGVGLASGQAWLEGSGIIRTQDFRRGEDPLVIYRVRTTGMSYLGEPLPIDPGILAQLYSDTDVFVNTSKNLIEIYDDFPDIISIRRPVPINFNFGGGRLYFTFADEARVWIDSVSCPASEWRMSQGEGLQYEFDGKTGVFRFYTSNNPTTAGTDVTDIVRALSMPTPGQSSEGLPNLFIPNGTGGTTGLEIDPSVGFGSVFATGVFTNDTSLGYTTRKYTSTEVGATGNFGAALRYDASVGWSDGVTFAGYAAGIYTFSIFVKANFSGRLRLSRDYAAAMTAVREFDGSASAQEWQRLSFPFWHDGSNRNLQLSCGGMPGTAGTAGFVIMALPMINVGPQPAAYVLPGLTIADGGAANDIHRLGPSDNYGRSMRGLAIHTASSGAAQNIATVTLPRNGTYSLEATFHARKADGTAHFNGVRRAVFKREGGTTTQLGTTETLGSDQADVGAAAYAATIDNSTNTIRFRETGDSGSVWEVDWKMSIKVT